MSTPSPVPGPNSEAAPGADPDDAGTSDMVRIHYRRLPSRETVYEQRIVHESSEVIVTLAQPALIRGPMTHDGRTMLEPGSRVVWFTFPDTWHDIGRFHDVDGRFTGLYANVLTPPRIDGPVWHTTDLFLDVWWPADGGVTVLDEDELAEALAAGHVARDLARRARAEADRLVREAEGGRWPPKVVEAWTLTRALEVLSS